MRSKKTFWSMILMGVIFTAVRIAESKPVLISIETVKDKIKGGWAGQTIGCTFGGPTEFRFRGTFIPDYQPLAWDENRLLWSYTHAPGLYDDVYMDLTFVEVFEKEGLDAPASAFANAFARAEYSLWHANQAARYNILKGIPPPESGHWLNNPHADDIDFQIEADFAGLMSPGMPNAASGICDRIGHIMNCGDGWYGGVFVAAMYSLAFVSDDLNFIVEQALKSIPSGSQFHQAMADVIRWHTDNPKDWKSAWFKVQEKWSGDVGCPEGVFTSYDIDAKINSAWILIGLLYGEKDFGKTVSISTRCGDDSDCNPSSAGGILGAVLGYSRIPDFWKQGLSDVESMDFKYTTISLNDVYEMGHRHALKMVQKNGGRIENGNVVIEQQTIRPVPLEVGFEGHYPVERRTLNMHFDNEASFEFEGIGFSVTGGVNKKGQEESVLQVEMWIDGMKAEMTEMPTRTTVRKVTPFWKYRLPMGKHEIRLKVLNPNSQVDIVLNELVVYSNQPVKPKF